MEEQGRKRLKKCQREPPVRRDGLSPANSAADERDDGLGVPDFLAGQSPRRSDHREPRKGSVVEDLARPTTVLVLQSRLSSSNGKDPRQMEYFQERCIGCRRCRRCRRCFRGGWTLSSRPDPRLRRAAADRSDPARSADLLPGEMKSTATRRPGADLPTILPPACRTTILSPTPACRLANDHRMAAWRRFRPSGEDRPWRAQAAASAEPKTPTPAMIAVAGTAWQELLASLGVSVKWIDDARSSPTWPGAGRARPPGRDGGPRLRDHGRLRGGGIRPRLVQLFAGGDEVAVADLELIGFAPIACLADVGCVAYGAGFEARVFMGQKLDPGSTMRPWRPASGSIVMRSSETSPLPGAASRASRRRPTRKRCSARTSAASSRRQIAYAASDAIMAFQVWEACRAEARSRPTTFAGMPSRPWRRWRWPAWDTTIPRTSPSWANGIA